MSVKKLAKVTITMGEKITKTDWTAKKVNGNQVVMACVAMMKDAQEFTGLQYKELFALVDSGLESKVFAKNHTMRASESEATAKEEE